MMKLMRKKTMFKFLMAIRIKYILEVIQAVALGSLMGFAWLFIFKDLLKLPFLLILMCSLYAFLGFRIFNLEEKLKRQERL